MPLFSTPCSIAARVVSFAVQVAVAGLHRACRHNATHHITCFLRVRRKLYMPAIYLEFEAIINVGH